MTRPAAARYPRAIHIARQELERRGGAPTPASEPLVGGLVGPGILRPPPQRLRPTGPTAPAVEDGASGGETRTDELVGELVDMVFVSADEARSGHHEVHLVFKADVLGGLHLRLERSPEGMRATFLVEDATARRAVAAHVDDIVRHLEARGFRIVSHEVKVTGDPSPSAP